MAGVDCCTFDPNLCLFSSQQVFTKTKKMLPSKKHKIKSYDKNGFIAEKKERENTNEQKMPAGDCSSLQLSEFLIDQIYN